MPTYKYTLKNGSVRWSCKFRYTDYAGEKQQKNKRGFTTQREAKEYERNFLDKLAQTPDVPFSTMIDKFMEDRKANVRDSTVFMYKNRLKYILPYFKDKATNAITPADVRLWQNKLLEKGYKPSFIKSVHVTLSAIFNYAIRFHKLTTNPCSIAGNISNTKSNSSDITFITVEQFNRLIEQENDYSYRVLFTLLFYTGLRIGEALALTPADIDLDAHTLSVRRTQYILEQQVVVYHPPKTRASERTISISDKLADIMREYITSISPIANNNLLFEEVNRRKVKYHIDHATQKAELPPLRIHDLRHSHASLLIELGLPLIAVRDRLGHESIKTTLDIYSHLYPTKQKEIADKLNTMMS